MTGRVLTAECFMEALMRALRSTGGLVRDKTNAFLGSSGCGFAAALVLDRAVIERVAGSRLGAWT